MSFILDALRKSEHERQRQSGPDIAPLHSAVAKPAFPVWAIAMAVLLAINIVVVLILVLRGGQQTNAAPVVTAAVTTEPAVAASTPQPQVAAQPAPLPQPTAPAAIQHRPLPAPTLPAPVEPSAPPVRSATIASPATTTRPADPMLNTPASGERLPSIHELNFTGVNALPPLHLDIHVYAQKPQERFVFINMNKYKEGGQTPEGIVVERITPDGVILNRNGTRFTLPRQ